MTETWRPVVGFESAYAVSDAGQVRRVATGRVLRPRWNGTGLPFVTLCASGRQRHAFIHHLVAEAFLDARPPVRVRYRDGDPGNTRLANLELLSARPAAGMHQPYIVHDDGTATVFDQRDGGVFAFLIDAADLPRLAGYPWRVQGHRSGNFYVHGGSRGRVRLHRLVLDAPAGVGVDHVNFDGLDCRRSNLRLADASVNGLNRRGARRGSRSGMPGVSWDRRRQRWVAFVRASGTTVYLGAFRDQKDAERHAWMGRACMGVPRYLEEYRRAVAQKQAARG